MALILTGKKSAGDQLYGLLIFTAFALGCALCVLLLL